MCLTFLMSVCIKKWTVFNDSRSLSLCQRKKQTLLSPFWVGWCFLPPASCPSNRSHPSENTDFLFAVSDYDSEPPADSPAEAKSSTRTARTTPTAAPTPPADPDSAKNKQDKKKEKEKGSKNKRYKKDKKRDRFPPAPSIRKCFASFNPAFILIDLDCVTR